MFFVRLFRLEFRRWLCRAWKGSAITSGSTKIDWLRPSQGSWGDSLWVMTRHRSSALYPKGLESLEDARRCRWSIPRNSKYQIGMIWFSSGMEGRSCHWKSCSPSESQPRVRRRGPNENLPRSNLQIRWRKSSPRQNLRSLSLHDSQDSPSHWLLPPKRW